MIIRYRVQLKVGLDGGENRDNIRRCAPGVGRAQESKRLRPEKKRWKQMAIDCTTRRRQLMERLEQYPELETLIDEALDMVENTNGEVMKADEAEDRAVALMRRTGRDLLQAW